MSEQKVCGGPKPTLAPDCQVIEGHYDHLKDWKMDPKGYFLIRVHEGMLEVGFCRQNNVVKVLVKGKRPRDVMFALVKANVTDNAFHLCYVADELQKAFIAHQLNIPYVQDDPLDVSSRQ